MDKDFKDYSDSKGDVLLQLLVFEHATGDVVIQMELGILYRFDIDRDLRAGSVYDLGRRGHIREAIDKAVAEQYGRGPEPPLPRIEKRGFDYTLVWADSELCRTPLGGTGSIEALNLLAGKRLPVVDASESQVKSEWSRVFPPEVTTTSTMHEVNMWIEKGLAEYMQREPAFTVWRLRVTR